MSKWNKLNELHVQTKGHHGYESFPKPTFKRVGKSALTELSSELIHTGLVSNIDISYNPGGIAVTGDFHIRGDFNVGGSFDMFFNMDLGLEICYRQTSSKKDYTGQRNQWMAFNTPLNKVVTNILSLQPITQEMTI